MVISQRGRKLRKATGGRYIQARSKKKHEIGRLPTMTKIGKEHIKTIKTKGGGRKMKVLVSECHRTLEMDLLYFHVLSHFL